MIDDNQLTPEEQSTDSTAGQNAPQGLPTQETTSHAGTEDQPTTPAESAETSAEGTPVSEEVAPAQPSVTTEWESTPEVVAEAAPEVADPSLPTSESDESVVDSSADEVEASDHTHTDYTQWSKQDLVTLLETTLIAVKEGTADLKATDAILKETKPVFEHIKAGERQEALQRFIEEGGDEEGFAYKADALTQKFDQLYGQIRGERVRHFQQAEKAREDNFTKKTELLNKLRELVENEEKSGAGEKSWDTFKQIQTDWKSAGNVSSAHNNTLWQTYHALVDRYFNNRNIYFELKELDRKRNMQAKIELIERVEKTAAAVQAGEEVSGKMLDDANELFEEFKHIGPAPKEVNEELWRRFKATLDTLYSKKREQNEALKTQSEEIYKLKEDIASLVATFTTFQSNSINEWNDKTKAILAIQDQWNAVKGPMPRDKGREMSQKFWGDIKTFFRNKGEFFRQLEAKRDENLRQKTALCEQVEALLESGQDSAETTQTVIELQRRWKSIGHVPEKMRDKIFDRFKKACDAFFERKRDKNAGIEKEFEANLAQKKALCDQIEQEAKSGDTDVDRLNAFKTQWAAIGFVPRKEIQPIQQRYIKAINSYVAAMGKLSAHEKEQLVLESEVELVKQERGRGGQVDLRGKENDIRRKIRTLEDEIAQMENNLAFFANSKNAEKIRLDFEKRIERSRKDLEQLQHQLRVVREAED
ncbi:DUF349 domain-containing protein [Siphonobacter sp. SORGH_AS_0500]|uniref:DUF349 domain-containing protein n=1 Tax=Siphonobacter sp. SORGH_AS_0500 TaxID=1864824 RepID=UPI002860E974|nr:DUF349 domain-containing protein [Siphonobacter sp. SORGH_AS_0500]MDR6195258.1 hypothetical protein [Siphonobacter sp. SORGH_AS_0500]